MPRGPWAPCSPPLETLSVAEAAFFASPSRRAGGRSRIGEGRDRPLQDPRHPGGDRRALRTRGRRRHPAPSGPSTRRGQRVGRPAGHRGNARVLRRSHLDTSLLAPPPKTEREGPLPSLAAPCPASRGSRRFATQRRAIQPPRCSASHIATRPPAGAAGQVELHQTFQAGLDLTGFNFAALDVSRFCRKRTASAMLSGQYHARPSCS